MRHLLIICALLLFCNVYSQGDCSKYYPFSEGTLTELTTYDKRGKVSAITEYKVTNVAGEKITMKTKTSDKDGEILYESEFDMRCEDDQIYADIKSIYSPQMMAQYENMQTSFSGSEIVYPNDMQVGDELDDAELFVSVDVSGISVNIDVAMTDRKVIGQERVTVVGGTFDCLIIEYQSSIKMGLERKGSAKQWFAEGVGMVKQEDYNRKGKVMSSTELTKFLK